ncbi:MULTISPECIES: hypothetical protein [Arthrobacter]|uniref:DUF8083 domain-containing protein n=2 Tax=Arthrobacter TaxID=1663 RepID=A0ABU9KJI6_9MICC|nr:hypothetical protein [Arthrobacter sp. YJM1]MDP5226446.1 hypothetical protein [Arthrobacter sp. YJM1]
MSLYDSPMGFPYVSSLRVYQPLEAFGPAQRRAILAQYGGALAPEHTIGWHQVRDDVERREMRNSLHRIFRRPNDPYPGSRAELTRAIPDPGEQGSLLYCPNQAVLRAALAAEELTDGSSAESLHRIVPTDATERHQERLKTLVSSGLIDSDLLFTRTATWGVPFAWFIFFHDTDRQEMLNHKDGSIATLRLYVSVMDAITRARGMVASLSLSAPELDFLEEMARVLSWLERFNPRSVMELDYGSVADKVYPDESPNDVRLGIECLAEGDMTGAAAAYQRLVTRWVPLRHLGRAS